MKKQSGSSASAPVSVIIPTWRRLDPLRKTLRKLDQCSPSPEEILVHVDAGDHETGPWLREHAPQVQVLESDDRMGPGGGRNRLLNASTQPYIVSLDDDSYPLDADYFTRVVRAFDRHPDAGMLAAVVTHRGVEPPAAEGDAEEAVQFMGCGCAYRRSAWVQTDGYLPRSVPYGMEETDLALQLLDRGWNIVRDRRLRVRHDTDLSHHDDPERTAGTIVNTALLPYVRYPVQYWPWGLLQYLNRIRWFIMAGRLQGIGQGLINTSRSLWEHRELRDPVSPAAIRKYRQLRG